MARTHIPFHLRGETLGFDHPRPWSSPALHLLFSAPRVYAPLAKAWERRNPGTMRALSRLVEMEFVAHQPPVVMDTVTGEVADKPGRAVERYRITAKGRRLLGSIEEDSGVLQEFTPKTSPSNRLGVQRLIEAANVEAADAPQGVSQAYLQRESGLADRTARWWIKRLAEDGYLRILEEKAADVRVVVPEHWRATRLLARHLIDIIESRALPFASEVLRAQYRLDRSRYLEDIDPTRVGLGGASDYDHDVGTQVVLAELMRSGSLNPNGVFTIEPRIAVPINTKARPWTFEATGRDTVFYQPDAEYREYSSGGVVRAILEYERYQTRRDGWGHLERLVGWMATSLLPFETVVLRFVVDSEPRARSYTELIEAFCDWLRKNPHLAARQELRFEVCSLKSISAAADPLEPRGWYRMTAPSYQGEGTPRPALHSPKEGPYDLYF